MDHSMIHVLGVDPGRVIGWAQQNARKEVTCHAESRHEENK
jgi:hypothetical protein